MLIYIHSAGRADGPQNTLRTLMDAGLSGSLRLVVQAREHTAYKARFGDCVTIIRLPPRITMLSPTRQWLLEQAEHKFILMDDDLRFATRRTDDPTKFRESTRRDVAAMLTAIGKALDKYTHVGVCAREGGNRMLADSECTRMMRLLAYNKAAMPLPLARFDRLPTKQDFDMTLQLLRQGCPNLVLHKWAHDQHGGSQSAGGCSTYRTTEMMDSSAHGLAELHPGYVRVVQKETKSAWGGGVRTDVQIAWKKAYKESTNADR